MGIIIPRVLAYGDVSFLVRNKTSLKQKNNVTVYMAVELKKPYYIVLLYIIVIIALDSLPGALKWYEIMNV